MPELPEVETAARDLAAQITGRTIAAIDKLDWERMIDTPDPASFRALLPGRQIAQVGRRGKWLLLRLDAGWTLAVHLRMSGSMSVQPAEAVADNYTHLVLALDNGARVFFRDVRKFGRVRLLDAAGLAELEGSLGPEPLSEEFTPADFAQRLASRRTVIKSLLLDQTFLAGLGNIYVDESLWRAYLHPLRPASSLQLAEVNALHAAIRTVLARAVDNRGSTLRDYRTGYGQIGSNQDYFAVYRQTGKPCPRCGTSIERMIVGQRSTHICPLCQQNTVIEEQSTGT